MESKGGKKAKPAAAEGPGGAAAAGAAGERQNLTVTLGQRAQQNVSTDISVSAQNQSTQDA